ncbi:MAG: hypothetical protein H6Q13_1058 [Bacteroidetes bacterium]|nr:hypothetical protein [Bacteroidota bacterium]
MEPLHAVHDEDLFRARRTTFSCTFIKGLISPYFSKIYCQYFGVGRCLSTRGCEKDSIDGFWTEDCSFVFLL